MASFSGKGFQRGALKDYREGLGKDPPGGMVPVGDSGIYASPDEPVDPRDCERWPDSPWCGGNPWTNKVAEVSVKPTISRCGVSFTAETTLGFTKGPEFSVAWISPDCRDEYNTREGITPNNYPPDPKFKPPQTNWPGGWDDDDEGLVIMGQFDWIASTKYYPRLDKFLYPYKDYLDQEYAWPTSGSVRKGNSIAKIEGLDSLGFQAIFHLLDTDAAWRSNINSSFLYYNRRGLIAALGRIGTIKNVIDPTDGRPIFSTRTVVEGWYKWYEIFQIIPLKLEPNHGPPESADWRKKECCMQCCTGGYDSQKKNEQDNAEILRLLRLINKKLGQFPFEVTLYDADENKKGAQSKKVSVKDCAEGLRTEIERTEKTSKMIGVDMFPLNLPKTVIEKAENNPIAEALDWINPFKNEKIDNLAEFNMWFFLQMSGILGHWQQQIKVVTPKLDKAGNPVKDKDGKPVEKDEYVILPDISQTLKELFIINTQSLKLQGLAYDTLIKACIDLVGTKVLAAEAAKRAEDIQQYLDYETDEKELDVPIQFKFPRQDAPDDEKNDLKRFLVSSTAKVIYDDWDAKGHKSFNESLTELEVAARIIHALFYQGNQ